MGTTVGDELGATVGVRVKVGDPVGARVNVGDRLGAAVRPLKQTIR